MLKINLNFSSRRGLVCYISFCNLQQLNFISLRVIFKSSCPQWFFDQTPASTDSIQEMGNYWLHFHSLHMTSVNRCTGTLEHTCMPGESNNPFSVFIWIGRLIKTWIWKQSLEFFDRPKYSPVKRRYLNFR